jgi:hypothetical protein
MNIQLDEDWTIESDAYSVMLRYSNIKGRKSGHSTIFYYPTVKMALQHYLNEAMKESSSIDDIFRRIDEVEAKIDNLDEKCLKGLQL